MKAWHGLSVTQSALFFKSCDFSLSQSAFLEPETQPTHTVVTADCLGQP